MEKLLFLEHKLDKWKRPSFPSPGSAHVFIGNGKDNLVIVSGVKNNQNTPTQGQIFFGKYTSYYEVDISERLLRFSVQLPSSDELKFNAEIRTAYSVTRPEIVIQFKKENLELLLKDSVTDVMRKVSRKHRSDKIQEAETSLDDCLRQLITDLGKKLEKYGCEISDSSSISLFMDKEIEKIWADRATAAARHEDDKTNIERTHELRTARSRQLAELVKEGDWQTLITMLDPNDADGNKIIMEMIRPILGQQAHLMQFAEATINKMTGLDQQEFLMNLIQRIIPFPTESLASLESTNKIIASAQGESKFSPEELDDKDQKP